MASGMRNMKMSLIYETKKYPVAKKKTGRGCGDMFLQFFAVPLPSLCRILQICESSLRLVSFAWEYFEVISISIVRYYKFVPESFTPFCLQETLNMLLIVSV